jgi:heme-degrading monooxygenase HmoA
MEKTHQDNTGMIMQIIRFKTELTEEDVLKIAREREARFRAIKGLIQKYYLKSDEPGGFAGVYIWDSMESLQAYRESDLAASIPKAYKITEPANIELQHILFLLRD